MFNFSGLQLIMRNKIIVVCSCANRMGFHYKSDALNLASLKEHKYHLIYCELPRGGQLSIYGNIMNVPCDENATVHGSLRPINESQTIRLIKLRR